jgi:hypothetical protein
VGTFGAGMTYYWRVYASNSLGTGPPSSIWSFSCSSATIPSPPVLLSPANGSTCVSLTPILDWQNVTDAQSYRVQISASPMFTPLALDVSGIVASQYNVVSATLSNNTTYYWRVNATNAGGTSDWSNTFNFTTAPILPPATTLLGPSNGATNISLTPSLIWCPASFTTSYRVQVSMSQSFTTMVYDTTIPGTQIVVCAGRLTYMTVYYWRVRTSNCSGDGSWTAPWSFVTNSSGVQTYSMEVPSEFKLFNNFPNPFNPVTKIRFDLPKTSGVKLKVFDLLGKEIATLVNEKLPPGKYETEFSIDNVKSTISSGIYFYKLETENFASVKRLVLIK